MGLVPYEKYYRSLQLSSFDLLVSNNNITKYFPSLSGIKAQYMERQNKIKKFNNLDTPINVQSSASKRCQNDLPFNTTSFLNRFEDTCISKRNANMSV